VSGFGNGLIFDFFRIKTNVFGSIFHHSYPIFIVSVVNFHVMTFDQFKTTLNQAAPLTTNPILVALWHDAKGDWNSAHEVVQDLETRDAAWIHAYLHRKEGDQSNAAYWYHRAGKPIAKNSLQEEWNELVEHFLK